MQVTCVFKRVQIFARENSFWISPLLYLRMNDYWILNHLCVLCLVFLMLSRLFIAALWSPAGKGLTFWLLLVMFIVIVLLSNVVSWVMCDT